MLDLILELFQYSDRSLLAASTYNVWLVLLSVLIAISASFMGFQVAFQAIRSSSSLRKHVSLLVGSIALGGGVWSMHFIGMLALQLCTSVSYEFTLTAISILPAIAASWVALNLIIRSELRISQFIWGGILVGGGIGTMHYVGMAAMEMAPLLRYDLFMFCVSILVAVILAILSLWISFGLDKFFGMQLSKRIKIVISSCVMGAAISGMHYTGMAAARFVLPEGIEASLQTDDISLYLALGLTVITMFIIGLTIALNVVFRYKDIFAKSSQNEKRLTAIMDTAVDGIITIDSRGIIVSINKAVTTLLGWESEDLLGQNVKILVPAPFHHSHDQYIENYIKTREAKIIGTGREVEANTKRGDKIPMRLGIGHVEFNNQHMFVAFISDLRERVKMEAALRENEAQIRSLLTNIPGIAYRCLDTPGWPNLFITDEVEKITGYPAKDFLLPDPKRSLGEFVHPDDLEMVAKTNLRDHNGFKLEFRLIDRYNNVKWMLGHGRASKVTDSDDYYLDGFIMDISERKHMESELVTAKETAEKAAESRAAFLANMSHEIRTPMNAVIGFSDILLDENVNPVQRKHLTTINQSAKSLLHILNDVLDSAKLDKGKFQLEYRDFLLVEEIDAVISTLWLQAKSKDLQLDLNIADDIVGYYNGAPDRIRQVLTNLLGNAIKFTERGRVVLNVSKSSDDTFLFSIVDTGIGMTEEQLACIFDAFSQADESMSRRFGGTGLGTTISKQLVELMGGEISATSVYQKGSEFSFVIPLKTVEFTEGADPQNNFPVLPKLCVLVVDDIEQNIELLSLLLKRHGHEIIEARDGEQALLQMQNNPIDLVLMDIQMPVMDGLTAAIKRRQLEEQNDWPQIPIIALTASVLPQDKISAEEAGMNGFSNKPIDFSQLYYEMAKVLKIQDGVKKPLPSNSQNLHKIDIEKGVGLWGSKQALYTEIKRFIERNKSEIIQIRELLLTNDWTGISAVAHKFKGVVGNLALNSLMELFAKLEQASAVKDFDVSKELIESIETLFLSISDSVSRMQESNLNSEASDNKVTTIGLEDLKIILSQLESSINNNEFNEELLEQLHNSRALKPTEIKLIIDACNDFEFSRAASLVAALIQSINSTK
ncbi:MHYT domain-containing protein [Paraglaciecola sp. L3A3]|uniref:MHYT domain-containing protein n=1 Tax=Paraglaciecola sp. L3A3 TaxID=2686358 RepID=UPI00131EABFE|nr:MHYT domain-containing protein [Paraglaciecola sp. L3A3]